jgi:hypothetical protein
VTDFSRRLLNDKFNPEEEKFADFENFVHEIFAQFIETLKAKEEFSMYQNDYFPI